MKKLPPANVAPGFRSGGGIGVLLVAGLLTLGLGLAIFAVAFQWGQTRRCLDFYGSRVARAVSTAPRVELWQLAVGPGGVVAARRADISTAPGLVHLRRGLVEDANFEWEPTAPGRLPNAAWDAAFAFFATPEAQTPEAVLAIDFAAGDGGLTVVGRPGRIGLGRMETGLRKWIGATAGSPGRGS
jgi:hypothetical protein